jgi:hypothetical protein
MQLEILHLLCIPCLNTINAKTIYDERFIPDLPRGRGRSIGGDPDYHTLVPRR